MKTFLSCQMRGLLVSAFAALTLAVPALNAADTLPAIEKPEVNAPVATTALRRCHVTSWSGRNILSVYEFASGRNDERTNARFPTL